jgi:putative flippase GtrA
MSDSLRQLLRYVVSGGTAAVVDVGGFALLRLIGMPIALCAVVSFCVAAVVNFLLSSRYVFHRTPTVRGFCLFFAAALGGALLNVSVTLLGSLYLRLLPELAKILGCGIAFLCNFWINQRVVFRRGPAAG